MATLSSYLSSFLSPKSSTTVTNPKKAVSSNPITAKKTTSSLLTSKPANTYMSMIPSNTGATAAKPTVIKTATKSPVATPAAQSYINTVATNTPSVSQSYASPVNNTGAIAQSQALNTPTPVPEPKSSQKKSEPQSAYLKYLTGMFDEEKLKQTQSNIDELNKRTSNEILRTRGREDELRKNEIGQLERGQSYQLGENERLSNRSLADLAIAKGAATEIYNQMINAGKTVFEAEEAAKKAEQENLRYQDEQAYKEEQDAYKKTQDQFANDLATKKFEEDKRQFGAQYALEQQKLNAPKPLSAAQEAKQLEQQDKEMAAQQSASQSIGIVNNLLNGGRYKAISGVAQTGSIPFFGDRTAVNEYNQLQGLLKLGVRSLIKGQGSISDYEGKVLGQAASSLSRLTGETQTKQALQTVRGILKTNNGQITPVTVLNPQTGERITTDLSGPEIYQLVSEGNVIEYK